MKKHLVLGISLLLSLHCTASAQSLKNTLKTIERTANDITDKQLAAANVSANTTSSASSSQTTTTNANASRSPFSNVQHLQYDYVRGSQLVFMDNFSADTVGKMPKKWTSNGNGTVSTLTIEDGNWFKLNDANTYKIKELVRIPENFTLEFDIVALSEGKNRFAIDFGFDYQKGVGNHYYLGKRNPVNIQASYWFNRFEFSSNEIQPNKYSEVNANMSYFANDVMKVKLRAVGDKLSVYVNDYKILETEMLDPVTKKYFYIAVNQEDKDAEIYMSNFRIDKI